LDEDAAKRGVVTHSSGNHGGALALAAKRRGIPAYVVVPSTCSPMKLANVRAFGADVRMCEPTVAAREAVCAEVMAETGATLVHPYDDPLVIAGQGTAALEMLEEVPDLQAIAVCISGGGLMSGWSIAAHGVNSAIEMIGVEPELAADAKVSIETGTLQPALSTSGQTIADGLRASLSMRTLTILREHLSGTVTVSEAEIIAMMRLTWERLKLVIEPSSAVPLAAVLKHRERFAGKRVGVIITGGNVSLDRLPWQA
ncbi:pyridoxal-phosphate dependent enzyme, partial [Phenylobacterium sp.]|uniref:pyridoxal-phosphate dependent enzyme n=1 Tax=Phenylobacterium sp. TaxID=1871053 RepID=UPI00286A2A7C